jgi:hypothetical protein
MRDNSTLACSATTAGSHGIALRLADRLREMVVEAPLQLLFAAFLLGIWVARRR